MRAAPPGYSDRTEFSCPGAPGGDLARQVGQETSVDVVLFAGMQQLAEILNGMVDVVERVVTDIHIRRERQGGMTGGDIAAVVDRRDVSVDDVTPARILAAPIGVQTYTVSGAVSSAGCGGCRVGC